MLTHDWPMRSKLFMDRCRKDPLYFCEHALGGDQPWERQADVLRAVRDAPRVAVRSGHGVGKTWTAARAALWFLHAHPRSIVLTTAPTQRQVRNILWGEIRRLVRTARVPLGGVLTETRLSFDDDWFALGMSTDEPERFQGYHAEHLLVIFDEAPGVPADIYEAARGLLTSRHARFLLIGNPVEPSGPFYDAFHSPEWLPVHIPCTACPNVAAGRMIYPRLVTTEWIQTQAREWGGDSPKFRARVLGEFPEESESRLIPLAWVQAAQARTVPAAWSGIRRMGVDVARFGADRTAFALMDGLAARVVLADTGLSTMETAGRVMHLSRAHGVRPERIALDDAGVGGGVTDRLREQRWRVTPVQPAGRPRAAHFANRRAELYWALRESLNPEGRAPLALPALPPQLIEELNALRYRFNSRGEILVESKDSLRARLRRSPDMADALSLAFAADAPAAPRIWVL